MLPKLSIGEDSVSSGSREMKIGRAGSSGRQEEQEEEESEREQKSTKGASSADASGDPVTDKTNTSHESRIAGSTTGALGDAVPPGSQQARRSLELTIPPTPIVQPPTPLSAVTGAAEGAAGDEKGKTSADVGASSNKIISSGGDDRSAQTTTRSTESLQTQQERAASPSPSVSSTSSPSLPLVDGHPLGPFGWEGEGERATENDGEDVDRCEDNNQGGKDDNTVTQGSESQPHAEDKKEEQVALAESPTVEQQASPVDVVESPTATASHAANAELSAALAESPTTQESPVNLAESPTDAVLGSSGERLFSRSPSDEPEAKGSGGAAHLWQRTALRARGRGRPSGPSRGGGGLARVMGVRPPEPIKEESASSSSLNASSSPQVASGSPLPSPTLAESPLGCAIDRDENKDPMESITCESPATSSRSASPPPPASPRMLPAKAVSAPVARRDVPSTIEMDEPEPTDLRRATLDPAAAGTRPRSHQRRTSSSHRVTETLDARIHADASGRRMVNQYAIGPTIGKGAYGNVEKAVDVGTGQSYAIKEFSKNRLRRQRQMTTASKIRRRQVTQQQVAKDIEATQGKHKARAIAAQAMEDGDNASKDPLHLIRREVAVMKKLDHPNLVSLFEAIDVPTSDSLYMVLEYLPGGTIMDIHVKGEPTEPLEPEQAREYFRQLVLGLEYLHENGVAHRDIKPDNILLTGDRKTVKLCDFGVSEMFEPGNDRIKKSAGSPAFMSPEAAVSTEQEIHAKAVDIWALGITLYCMLRGRLPFVADTPIQLYEAIRDSPAPIPHRWDTDVKALIAEMLRKDPQQRIKMTELKQQAWVTRRGADPLPSTEENLYDIGQEVVEPTAEEISKAITNWRGVFTVIRAIQKMKRPLRKSRQNSTTSSQGSSAFGDASLSPFAGPRTMSPRQDSGSEFSGSPQQTVGTSFDDYDDDKGDF